MRVVYTDTDEPTMTFDGRELVLHVSRYASAVAPTPLPVEALRRECARRENARMLAAFRTLVSRRGPGGFWIV